jgi:hypothetical protein
MEGMTKRDRFIPFASGPVLPIPGAIQGPGDRAGKTPAPVLDYSSCHTDRKTMGVHAWDETARLPTNWTSDLDPAHEKGHRRTGGNGGKLILLQDSTALRVVVCWHCLQDFEFLGGVVPNNSLRLPAQKHVGHVDNSRWTDGSSLPGPICPQFCCLTPGVQST